MSTGTVATHAFSRHCRARLADKQEADHVSSDDLDSPNAGPSREDSSDIERPANEDSRLKRDGDHEAALASRSAPSEDSGRVKAARPSGLSPCP